MEWKVEPISIHGLRQQKSGTSFEVLVRRKDLPLYEQTWECMETIDQQFPEFHLEDKVKVWQGSIDKPPVKYTYALKRKRESSRKTRDDKEV